VALVDDQWARSIVDRNDASFAHHNQKTFALLVAKATVFCLVLDLYCVGSSRLLLSLPARSV